MSINRFPSSTSCNNSGHSKPRCSMRALVAHLFAKRSISQPNPPDNNQNVATTAASTTNIVDDQQGGALAHPNMIRQDLLFIKKAFAKAKEHMGYVDEQINKASKKFEALETGGSEGEVEELRKKVRKLKSQIVSNFKIRSADSNPHQNTGSDDESSNSSNQLGGGLMHKLYGDPRFEETAFERIKVSFLSLPFKLKLCLLCFLNFPEKAIIKKRCMIYWRTGVGILPPSVTQERTAEDFGNTYLDELIAKGFIEAKKKGGFFLDSCWMQPLVRSALTTLAHSIGYNLVRSASTTSLADSVGFNVDEFQCWLNDGETAIDDSFKLFSKMEHIKILYLGRWQSKTKHHIEVQNTKIFDGLTFLCLRGISLVTELPEFVSQLSNLKILDLRACHNLEEVPDGIGLLKRLTHLDMSECYFLHHMPESHASLSQLQVLKGFVISGHSNGKKSCTLDDLAKLRELRKLSIYTSVKDFPTEQQLRVLQNFEVLRKLTISWGVRSPLGEGKDTTFSLAVAEDMHNHPGVTEGRRQGQKEAEEPTTADSIFELPLQLEKLEIRGFPEKIAPGWLRPANMKRLKKLYIRGGQFCDLKGEQGGEQWNVEILSLKYLSGLKIDGNKVGKLFPKLKFLEVAECPKFGSLAGWGEVVRAGTII